MAAGGQREERPINGKLQGDSRDSKPKALEQAEKTAREDHAAEKERADEEPEDGDDDEASREMLWSLIRAHPEELLALGQFGLHAGLLRAAEAIAGGVRCSHRETSATHVTGRTTG